MSQLLAAAVACALAAAPDPVTPSLEPASPPRVSLGVSVALWMPGGELVVGRDADGATGRSFPLELRAGWRVTPELELGLAGGYAFASIGSAQKDWCDDRGVTCDVHLWRAAARAEYRRRTGRWYPWGAGLVGWERFVERWEADAANWERQTLDGWLAQLEAGIDAPAVRSFDIGIFVTFGVGQYRWRAVSGETSGYPYEGVGDVANSGLHRWLGIGVRGTLGI